MNNSNIFNYSLDHCIKVNITWLSQLIEALPKATEQEVKEVMRFNRNAMQMQLIDYVDQAQQAGKDYPAARYHATMCRAYVSEQDEKQAALDGNEILKKNNGTPYSKKELKESVEHLQECIRFHGNKLVEVSHPNCDGPHDIIIGDRYITLD